MTTHRYVLLGLLLAGTAAVAAEQAPPLPSLSAGVSAAGPHHAYLVGQLLLTDPTLSTNGQPAGEAVGTFEIVNRGRTPETLVGLASAGADAVSLAGGATAALTIPPRGAVTLKADGLHLRVQGLRGGAGTLRVDMMFDRAGPLPVDFAVESGPAPPPVPLDPGEVETPPLAK